MVTKRFLAVFYPGRRIPGNHAHHARRRRAVQERGKVLVMPGWLTVYGKEAQDEGRRRTSRR